MEEGKVYKTSFPFTNTGNDTLYINTVKTSCGCTIAKYPTQGIAPGNGDTIFVELDTKDKRGALEKVVHVFSNARNRLEDIQIKGFVE